MDRRVKHIDNKNFFIEYGKCIIGGYHDLMATYEVIKKTSFTMSGKVFNKRFTTEIEKHLEEEKVPTSVYLSDEFNLGYKTLKIYLKNRSKQICGSWEYFDNEVYCCTIHNCEKEFVDNNGRVIGEKVVELCDKMIKECKKHIEEWQDAIDNYDENRNTLANALKEFGEVVKGLNPLFKPYNVFSFDWEK